MSGGSSLLQNIDVRRVAAAAGLYAFITLWSAAWSVAFVRKWNKRLAPAVPEQIANAMRQVRKVGASVVTTQLALFFFLLIEGIVRHQNNFIWLFPLALGALFTTGQVQFYAEKQIRNLDASLWSAAVQNFRGLFLGIALQLGVMLAVGYAISLQGNVIDLLHLTGWIAIVVRVLWYPFAIGGVLYIFFALSPWTLRLLLPSSPNKDQNLDKTISDCFSKAGVSVPSINILESERFGTHNALIAGFSRGKGIFKPVVFISRTIVEKLTPDELYGVLAHELSHLVHSHLRDRMILVLLMALAWISWIFIGGLTAFLIINPVYLPLLYLLSFFGYLSGQMTLMRRLVRNQEIEADVSAIMKFGANADAFASALRRLAEMNAQLMGKKDPSSYLSATNAHPSFVERIEKIRSCRESRVEFKHVTLLNSVLRRLGRKAFPLGLALMSLFVAFYIYIGKPNYLQYQFVQAVQDGDLQTVQKFIGGKSIHLSGSRNTALIEPPMMIAAKSGRVEILQELIRDGADFNAPDKFGITALGVARRAKQTEIVKILQALNALDDGKTATGDRAISSEPSETEPED